MMTRRRFWLSVPCTMDATLFRAFTTVSLDFGVWVEGSEDVSQKRGDGWYLKDFVLKEVWRRKRVDAAYCVVL